MPSVLFRMGGDMWLQTVLEPLSYDTLMEMTTACVDYDTILILKRINGWFVTAVMRNGEAVACMVDSALSACLVSLRVQRDSEMRRFPGFRAKLNAASAHGVSVMKKFMFVGFISKTVLSRVDAEA